LSSLYAIPRLYIKGARSDEEYLVEKGGDVYERSRSCPEASRCFGKVIYGVELESIIDLVGKRVARSFIVEYPDKPGEGLLVPEGVYVEPIPVYGRRAVVEVREGEEVRQGQVIGTVLTGKYEVRRVRSHVEGIVVYIYSSPLGPPDENIVVIVPRESVKRVKILG